MRTSAGRTVLPAIVLVAVLALSSRGAVTSSTIPFAPYGDSIGGSAGVPVVLTSTSFVAAALGAGNAPTTADDILLLVTGVGGTPVVTPIATPFSSSYSGAICRLSPTRVLAINAGATTAFNTADDGVYLIDDLGGANTVTNITVGFLQYQDGYTPVALDDRTAVLCSRGPDGTVRTADDVVVLITDIGGTNTVTPLAAPFLTIEGRGRPVPLTPNSFLVVSDGADGTVSTADDLTYLFTDVGGTNTRTTLVTPFLFQYAASTPVRLTATRAVVGSLGVDGVVSSADDRMFLLDDLGGTNTVTPIPVPSMLRQGAGVPVALGPASVLISAEGADDTESTTDDTLELFTDLGGANTRTSSVVGGLGADRGCRAVILGPGTVAVTSGGADGNFYNADDQVVLVSKLGKSNKVTRIPLGGLDEGSVGRIVPLGPDSFLLANGGVDGIFGSGGDDRFTVVTKALRATPGMEHIATAGDLDSYYAAVQPQILGAGRAVGAASGTNNNIYYGADDLLQVLEGLPTNRGLAMSKATLKFDDADPGAGETVSIKGKLGVVGANTFDSHAVFVQVGGATQVLDQRFITHKGTSFKYSDPDNLRGWVTKLSCNAKSGAFSLSGEGVGTGIETSNPDALTVSVTGANDIGIAETVVATADDQGMSYKAPK